MGPFFLHQPNRGFLRSLRFSRALGVSSEPATGDALRAAGIKKRWVEWLAREEHICSSNAAVYVFQRRIIDRVARTAVRHPAMTAGLTTALWLHNVLPTRPPVDHWMIAQAKHRPIWLPPDVRVHRSRHGAEDTFLAVLSGSLVRAHVPLRAALDCVRFRGALGDDVALAAIRATLASGVVELQVLLAHAKRTKVHEPLLRLLTSAPAARAA